MFAHLSVVRLTGFLCVFLCCVVVCVFPWIFLRSFLLRLKTVFCFLNISFAFPLIS